jgi:hypothetical protein
MIHHRDRIKEAELKLGKFVRGADGRFGTASRTQHLSYLRIEMPRAFVAEVAHHAAPKRRQSIDARPIKMAKPLLKALDWISNLHGVEPSAVVGMVLNRQRAAGGFEAVAGRVKRQV